MLGYNNSASSNQAFSRSNQFGRARSDNCFGRTVQKSMNIINIINKNKSNRFIFGLGFCLFWCIIALIIVSSKRKSSEIYISEKNSEYRNDLKRSFYSYEIDPSAKPTYTMTFELVDIPFDKDLRSLTSTKYLTLVNNLESNLNRMFSKNHIYKSSGTDKSQKYEDDPYNSYAQVVYFDKAENGHTRAHVKIFADIFRLMFENNTHDGPNLRHDNSAEIIANFITDLLSSNNNNIGPNKIYLDSFTLGLHSNFSFFPIDLELTEDDQCRDLPFIIGYVGDNCPNIFSWLIENDNLQMNDGICQSIQILEHCLVSEIRPFRCTVDTIHEVIIERLSEINAISEKEKCQSGCLSIKSLFYFILPQYCSVELSDFQNSFDGISYDCDKFNQVKECAEDSLAKKSLCPRNSTEELIRKSIQGYFDELGIDIYNCTNTQCAGGNLNTLITNYLQNPDNCFVERYTLEVAENDSLPIEEYCPIAEMLVDCVDNILNEDPSYENPCLNLDIWSELGKIYSNSNFGVCPFPLPGPPIPTQCEIDGINIIDSNPSCNDIFSNITSDTTSIKRKCLLYDDLIDCLANGTVNCTYSELFEDFKQITPYFSIESCIYTEGLKPESDMIIFNNGPIVINEIVGNIRNAKLTSIEFFAALDSQEIQIQLWENSGNSGTLLSSYDYLITRKGVITVDLNLQDFFLEENQSIGIYFKDFVAPIPSKTEVENSTLPVYNAFIGETFSVGDTIEFNGLLEEVVFSIRAEYIVYDQNVLRFDPRSPQDSSENKEENT
ncbi:MAG: hypothetical protein MHPSP_001590, partial [Paramarteilia canceri]